MEKKVALKDIAKKAGVSAALVSYVLNGKEKQARVSPDMAAKIRKIATELNYQPNLIAKSLQSGRTSTIGLIVADISNPFFSSIARIVEDEAKKHGYVVIFGSSYENAEKQQNLIDVFANRQVDAFIIAAAEGTEDQLKALVQKKIPVVLIDRFFPDLHIDSVHIDNLNISSAAVKQLIKNGRRKIAMAAYHTQQSHMADRKEGYKAGLQHGGIRFKKDWLVEINYENIEKDISGKLGKLLKPLQIDALFFATNSLAVAGLKEIVRLGIKVPEDLAVISFDEPDAFAFFYSPITYVNQPLNDIGKEAVTLAINHLKQDSAKNKEVTVDARLVIQKSCGNKR